MARERTHTPKQNPLSLREYDIAGNHIRAYFDAAGALVFVIDETLGDVMPNVLLVMHGDGTRKWDDILVNDYGVDLETVRPRRDNKYQKLDIEYSGLGVYDDLIRAYDSGNGVDVAITELNAYRDVASRDLARARLAAAEMVAERARDTIDKTNASITELNSQVRKLRTQLSQQRRAVGREPTKRSASKILRTESQIDVATEKLGRARRRLTLARRRLAAAASDADVAREILARPNAVADMRTKVMGIADMRADEKPANIMMPSRTNVTKHVDAPVPASIHSQTKVDDMADQEVKPLFEKNPNIMDSGIAFKPIEFNIPAPAPDAEPVAPHQDGPTTDVPDFMPVPLSFDADNNVNTVEQGGFDDTVESDLSVPSVLNSMRPVMADDAHDNAAAMSDDDAEIPTPILPTPIVENNEPGAANPQDDDQNVVQKSQSSDSMPEISVATNSSGFRPVSPITGGTPADVSARRPTLIYYVMLMILIVLSIFTLWLYQRNGKNTMPNLVSASNTKPDVVSTIGEMPTDNVNDDDMDLESPFIMGDADSEFIPSPSTDDVVPPVPSPEVNDVAPVPVMPAEPESVAVAVDVPAIPAPDAVADVAPDDEPTDVAPEYVVDEIESPVLTATDDATAAVDKPAYSVAPVASVVPYDGPMCDDGTMPNDNGCCGAEEYSQMADGTFACCLGDECFPTMF